MKKRPASEPPRATSEKDWQGANLRVMNVRKLTEFWKAETEKGRERIEIGQGDPDVEEFDTHFLNGFMSGMSLFNLRETSAQRPVALLDLWAVFLPQRIVDEDLADYREDIHRRIARGEVWQPGVRALAAVFWTGVNAIGYVVSNLIGRAKAS